MDLFLVNIDNTWDIDVFDGVPLLVEGLAVTEQIAAVAAYQIVNTIPAAPDVGNPWPEFLAGDLTLPEIDTFVRKSINRYTNNAGYFPTYEDTGDGKLNVVITKMEGLG